MPCSVRVQAADPSLSKVCRALCNQGDVAGKNESTDADIKVYHLDDESLLWLGFEQRGALVR